MIHRLVPSRAQSTPPARGNNPPHETTPSPPPPGAPRIPPWIWWLVLVVLIAWNAWSFLAPGQGQSIQLDYTQFLAQVRAGSVASVGFDGQAISGTFDQAVVVLQPSSSPVPSPAASPAPANSPASAPWPDSAAPGTYASFATIMPAFGDPGLLPLLEQQHVDVTAQDTSTGGSLLLDIVLSVWPIVLLVGLFVLFARRMQRSQQGIFGFGGSKPRLYDVERPKVSFADVAGEDDAKRELSEVVEFLRDPSRFRRLGARLPRGLLLIGPPGTGKTLLARAVAGEAAVPFFSISATEFVEMFVGVGASRVRDLFSKAKSAAPSIVFVDEIDAVGRQRGTGLGGGNDEREQTLNQLLVEMDGFDENTSVIVIAATNRPDVLDPALLRPGRFDRQVTVGFPDRAGREAILAIHTRGIKLDGAVDLERVARATPGFSGADLANLANEAALLAARDGSPAVRPEHFDGALDRILLGTRQSPLVNDAERRLVAYHEAGHAVVALLTPGADPVQKVTIVPRGMALGATEQLPDEERRNYPYDYLVGRLTVMLGGRAAEELVFGQPTSGAENDLRQATELARRMVGLWGMADDLGPVYYGVGETHPFLGRELAGPRQFAESTAGRIDRAVRSLLDDARNRAAEMLTRQRTALAAVADELVASEVVSAARLDEILRTGGAVPIASAGTS
jgi:cell division protease FtsH